MLEFRHLVPQNRLKVVRICLCGFPAYLAVPGSACSENRLQRFRQLHTISGYISEGIQHDGFPYASGASYI